LHKHVREEEGLRALPPPQFFFREDTMTNEETLRELAGDPELYFAVQEHSHGTGVHAGGASDAGERVIAAKTRVSGADQLQLAIGRLSDVFRAGGWNGTDPVTFAVDATPDHENAGRAWTLRGAISDATFYVPAGKADPAAAETAVNGIPEIPDAAVEFRKDDDHLIMDLRYLSDGHASSGDRELRAALSAIGYRERI
jgi:hypothetical protein